MNKSYKAIAWVLLFWAEAASAQVGNFPALVGQRGATNPTNCAIGQLFFNTGNASGGKIMGCESANTWVAQGGGAASSVTAGTTTVTSGGANAVLFENASQILSADGTNFLYSATGSVGSGPQLQVGSGSTTSQGWKLGEVSSAMSGIWPTSVTASTTNYALGSTGGITELNSASRIDFNISDTANLTLVSTLLKAASTTGIGWTATNSVAALDTSLSRGSAGVVNVGTGAVGSAAGGLSMTSLTASGTAIIFSGLATDATKTDATVCVDTTTGQLYKGSGAVGICLGTSSARYKTNIRPLEPGLLEILALNPVRYYTDAQHGDPKKPLYGFTAEQGGSVLPELMGKDAEGRPNTFDYLGVVPVLVKAIQEQQAQIAALTKRIDGLSQMKYAKRTQN